MIECSFFEMLIGLMVLVLSASELYKGIRMVFWNQNRFLFMAKIGFLIFHLIPQKKREERYQHALKVYKKRRKIYGFFAILGGAWGILLSYVIFINA